MKAIMLISGNGALVILTSHAAVTEPSLLDKLHSKGIDKFIAFDVPMEMAKERYGGHFDVVMQDLHETNDQRILDYNGARAFKLFMFDEMYGPTYYEGPEGA